MKSKDKLLVCIIMSIVGTLTLARAQKRIITMWDMDLATPLPPLYTTALTNTGFTVGAGIAYQTIGHSTLQLEIGENETIDSYWGGYWYHRIRPGVNLTYGFTQWLAAVSRGGMLIDPTSGDTRPAGGIGMKFSTPWHKYFSASVSAEADYPNWFVATVMMGGVTAKGHELITLGYQFGLSDYYNDSFASPGYFFLNLHPVKGMHIVAALAPDPFWSDLGGVYTSIGYTYNIVPRTTRIRKVIIIEEETYTD